MNKLTGDYYCELCNYTTDRKYNYNKHLLTKGHTNLYNHVNSIQQNISIGQSDSQGLLKDSSKTALNLSKSTVNFSESTKDLVKTNKELIHAILKLLNDKFK